MQFVISKQKLPKFSVLLKLPFLKVDYEGRRVKYRTLGPGEYLGKMDFENEINLTSILIYILILISIYISIYISNLVSILISIYISILISISIYISILLDLNCFVS